MDEKQIGRYLRRQFRIPGYLLVAYFALLNVMVLVTVFVDSLRSILNSGMLGDPISAVDTEAIMNNAWGYLAAVAIALLILFAWKDRSFWYERVLAKGRRMGFATFAILLCFSMAAQLINSFWIGGLEVVMNIFGKSVMDVLESVSGSSDSLSMFLYASIAAPISEELIFRGYIQRSLEPFGRKFSIFASALLFGVFHGNLLQIPYAFIMGLLLGYVAAEYHIGWAVAIHMFNNLVLADLLSRLTANFSGEVASAITLILLGSATVAAGVVAAVKHGHILAYLRSDWLDRRCLKWFFLNSGMILFFIVMLINSLAIFAV